MKDISNNLRLMESGFPCHQVGAETQRERGSSSALPPLYFLHVWWARRPLIPSRAAIQASLLGSATDPEAFVRDLGIRKKVALIGDQEWTLVAKALAHVHQGIAEEVLLLDEKGMKFLEAEIARRARNLDVIERLISYDPAFSRDPVVTRWAQDSAPFPHPLPGEGTRLRVEDRAADPAHVNDRLAFAKLDRVKQALGDPIRWDLEYLYAYGRAYANAPEYRPTGLTVLDATSGGGSIPFEALRLGHTVIANELNPVATTILHATLDYPARFGPDLLKDIQRWGDRLVSEVEEEMLDVTPRSPLPEPERQKLEQVVRGNPELMRLYGQTEHDQNGILYCRMVTCPSCGGEAPLLNSLWLSKVAGDQWGVRVVPDGGGTANFEVYQATGDRGPNGEDPDGATVSGGVGQCVHCRQAIASDEIKAQARGESRHGTWWDRVYAVHAARFEPKMDAHGRPQRYASGDRKGEIKTRKAKFFRAPTDQDETALSEAKLRLESNWGRWERDDLIPTEAFPVGNDMRPALYGMSRWCDMFAPRQLLGHLTLVERFRALQPEIRIALGEARGNAVTTYLQFMVDKFVDYNSRQTRWIPQRTSVSGTFSRHDFSLKWTFGEMPYAGPASGLLWALSQVMAAYKGIAELAFSVHESQGENLPLRILNGSAGNMSQVATGSVDLVCFDPPYYNNVQYGELSDFYYVWQKRGLRDVFPGLFSRRQVNKADEAVANPSRDGSAAKAKVTYERMMSEIFTECRRVLSDDGVMTLMFTHKKQEAWETLTRSLIESGWVITACMPVESEFGYSTHQMNLAAAASTIFITCRKRVDEDAEPAAWQGIGGTGVSARIRAAVRDGLTEFERLKLSPVDEMIASFGRALQVLSERWPVYDGDEVVSPVQAMTAASAVVAAHQITRITAGRLSVEDLDTETGIALTVLGAFGPAAFAFDDARNLANALNVAIEGKNGNYTVADRKVGLATQQAGATYAAPLVKSGSKVRLAAPEERASARLEKPQTAWDRLHGLITAYREGEDILVRAYFEKHCLPQAQLLRDLLEVYRAEIGDEGLQKEIDWVRFALESFGDGP
jgi:adenine-specific DNA methylase